MNTENVLFTTTMTPPDPSQSLVEYLNLFYCWYHYRSKCCRTKIILIKLIRFARLSQISCHTDQQLRQKIAAIVDDLQSALLSLKELSSRLEEIYEEVAQTHPKALFISMVTDLENTYSSQYQVGKIGAIVDSLLTKVSTLSPVEILSLTRSLSQAVKDPSVERLQHLLAL